MTPPSQRRRTKTPRRRARSARSSETTSAVYYFHDDGTDFQVPARAVHHAEQALVHLKLALDVARQLHLIS